MVNAGQAESCSQNRQAFPEAKLASCMVGSCTFHSRRAPGSCQDCRAEELLLGIHTLMWSLGVKVAGRRAALHLLQKILASGYWLLQGSKFSSRTVATSSHHGLSLFCVPSPHQWTFAEMTSNPQNPVGANPLCPFHTFGH